MDSKKGTIVVISPSAFPGTAGDSANYLELVSGFNRAGLQVALVCPNAPGGKVFDEQLRGIGISVTRIPLSPPRISDVLRRGLEVSVLLRLLLFYILEIFVVTYVIVKNRARVCMVRHSVPTIPLAPLLRILGVQSVADGDVLYMSREWETLFSPSIRRILRLLEKWRQYSFFKVTSESQLKLLTESGFPKNRIILTSIGVNVSGIPSFDISEIPPATFGFFGILNEWQQVDFLLRSFAKVIQKDERPRLYVIGDGPSKSDLSNLSKKLGLERNVFFCGAVPRRVLWHEYFRKFRVALMVRSEWMDHQPIKLAEALAAGKPVIATAVKSLKRLRGKGLFLVSPGDEEEMARAMELLVEDERLLRRLSRQALRAALDFDVNRQIEKIVRAVGY